MNGMIVATKGWIQSKGIEVATRGIISTWKIRVIRVEILRYISRFARVLSSESSRRGNG
jgi:hypothetical protein